ncbi:hypothetical protein [Glycomyces tritici]|uniref:DUF559 domain-containing protein n=1 Tax=Glycomyces tritici TaxID=2665176 RepID=A0ABT7YYR1_9ACTN|nr:hypothetical protein [Glycomyces tritici]MDN3243351.1 hypothetical protein [Glycomyces tritici]MDN3243772.1 hypothetical protein [Glycomyces tritici]
MTQIPMYRTMTATMNRPLDQALHDASETPQDLLMRFEAAFEANFSLVATGRTAAWIHGFDVLPPGADQREWPVESSPDPPLADITVIDGLPVTRLARTLVDCAADLPRLEAVAAADQFLRAGIDAGSLSAALEPLHGDRLRRANATLLAADPRSESPMESWTRCLVSDAGLPAPVPQLRVRTPNGRSRFLNLGWEQWRVGVEYDGLGTHLGLAAEAANRPPRHQVLENLGWEVLVLTASDVMEHPRPWLVRLREMLLDRGWDPDTNELRDINERIEAVHMAVGRG